MTYEQALTLYRAGRWIAPAPPVCTARWTEADWVFFVFGVRP